jgi:hypothetical protein
LEAETWAKELGNLAGLGCGERKSLPLNGGNVFKESMDTWKDTANHTLSSLSLSDAESGGFT